MKRIEVGIIGAGWSGGIRAETCTAHPDLSAERNEAVSLPAGGAKHVRAIA